jgi:parallel beta-helix repeat protein
MPSIFNNMIHNNEGDGVRIVVNANPTIKGNMIYDNNRVGIHVYREGCGTCTDNQIYGNKNAGMQVYGGGNTTVIGNKIHHNKCSGVYVSDRAAVAMQDNEVSHNGDCGIEVVSGASVSNFERNIVHHNRSAGVAVYQDTRSPHLERVNTIHSNGANYHTNSTTTNTPTDTTTNDPMDIDVSGPQHTHTHNHTHNKTIKGVDVIMREGKAVYPRSGGRRDETMEIVSFLAERAIQSKLCTFMLTREYYHAQYWYECRTCSSPRQILGRPEVSVCEQCAKTCHAGHELSPRKFGHFYCDCGQLDAPVCKCVPSNFSGVNAIAVDN